MHEIGQIIVVDTTPLIALTMIGHLDLLAELYGQITIPVAVSKEVLAGGPQGIGIREFQRAKWIRIATLKDPPQAELLSKQIGVKQKRLL